MIKLSNSRAKQIEKWLNTPPLEQGSECPFNYTEQGGEICAELFHQIEIVGPEYRRLPHCGCHASTCPCHVYNLITVIKTAKKVLKEQEK